MTTWILTDERINDLQVTTVSTLVERARRAHFCNVYLRINGTDEVFEADWLKHLQPITPQPQCREPTIEDAQALYSAMDDIGQLGGRFTDAIFTALKQLNFGRKVQP